MVKSIGTHEIIEHIFSKLWMFIDVRSPDAYNGWLLNGEKRNGHLPGAKNLPAKWLKYIDWIEIVYRKNIHPDHNIVIYGSNSEELRKVAARFEKSDFKNIFIYEDF